MRASRMMRAVRPDVSSWHQAADSACPLHVRSWGVKRTRYARSKISESDPQATSRPRVAMLSAHECLLRRAVLPRSDASRLHLSEIDHRSHDTRTCARGSHTLAPDVKQKAFRRGHDVTACAFRIRNTA